PVVAERGLRVRPCTVEQTEEPMMEHIGEAPEAWVVEVQLARVRVLRQVQRQRPVRTEQPEEIDADIARLVRTAGAKLGDGRRCERQRRRLPEPNGLVGR